MTQQEEYIPISTRQRLSARLYEEFKEIFLICKDFKNYNIYTRLLKHLNILNKDNKTELIEAYFEQQIIKCEFSIAYESLNEFTKNSIHSGYENKMYLLYNNLVLINDKLDKTPNFFLIDNILFDDEFCKSIGIKKNYELNPLLSKNMLNIIDIEKNNSKIANEVQISKIYECKKCGSKRITEETKQLRASDEGGTVILTCADCGFRRRFEL